MHQTQEKKGLTQNRNLSISTTETSVSDTTEADGKKKAAKSELEQKTWILKPEETIEI
jgi:hypothetical protein